VAAPCRGSHPWSPITQRSATNPDCHAGVSFTTLRDTAPFPPSPGARRAFLERLAEMLVAARDLAETGDERAVRALRQLEAVQQRAERGFTAANQRAAERSAPTASADGEPNESAPPVNLLSVREAGPYAVRGQLAVAGNTTSFRATPCRCGASKNKPYCDDSHHEIGFSATGEPASGTADMLEVRGGPLEVEPQVDGPLQVSGNLEIISGTGRVVARLTQTRLCRCGGSANKPYCDGTHARIGFRS
jgi:CDGSH-type Zn-finger protein